MAKADKAHVISVCTVTPYASRSFYFRKRISFLRVSDGVQRCGTIGLEADGQIVLLRAIVIADVGPAVVATVYCTKQIQKYWRQA